MDQNERELFLKYRATRAAEDRNAVCERYYPLAAKVAAKYANRGVEYDDLCQVALLALLKAVERFDPDLGLRFATYAVPTIEGEIKNYFRDKSRAVRLPRRYAELSASIRKALDRAESEGLPAPSSEELGRLVGATAEDVEIARETPHSVSLDEAEAGEGESLYARVPAETDDIARLESEDELHAAIGALDERERELVRLRFGEGKSQSEIAKGWSVSQMSVSRLERKVLGKLRAALAESD